MHLTCLAGRKYSPVVGSCSSSFPAYLQHQQFPPLWGLPAYWESAGTMALLQEPPPHQCHQGDLVEQWYNARLRTVHRQLAADRFPPCENTRAAWQLFFTARTWAKPHRFDSSVTLLLRRVVQSKTQWHSNVLKLLRLLQKSSQASKTFFQLLQIKRLQLKLTNNLQNSYQISSQHQVPKTWVKQHPKHQRPQKQTKIHLQALPCTDWFHLVPNWFLPGSYRFLWVL